MASQSELENLHAAATALGQTVLSCPVGAQRATPIQTGGHHPAGSTVIQLYHTQLWLEKQIEEHRTALAAGRHYLCQTPHLSLSETIHK